jgi:hypothetical protein
MRLSRMVDKLRNVSGADADYGFGVRQRLHFSETLASCFDKACTKLPIHIGFRQRFYRRNCMGYRRRLLNSNERL